jgi:hypothetical protein
MSLLSGNMGVSGNNYTAAEYIRKVLLNLLKALIQKNQLSKEYAELIYENGGSSNEDLPALVKDFSKHYNEFQNNAEEVAQKVCLGYIKLALQNLERSKGRMNNSISIGNDSFSNGGIANDYFDYDDELIVRKPKAETKNETIKEEKVAKNETKTEKKSSSMKLTHQDYEMMDKYVANPPDCLGNNLGYDADINLPGTLTCVKHRSMEDKVIRDNYSYINLRIDEPMYDIASMIGLINNKLKSIRPNYYSVVDYDHIDIIDEEYEVCLNSINDIRDSWKTRRDYKPVIDAITKKSFRFVRSIEKLLINRINTYLKRYFILDDKSFVVSLDELSECEQLVPAIMKSNSSLATLGYGTVSGLANDIIIAVFEEFFKMSTICNPRVEAERNIILHNPDYNMNGSGYNRKVAYESQDDETKEDIIRVLSKQSVISIPRQFVLTNVNNRIFFSNIVDSKKNAINLVKENNNPLTSLLLFHIHEALSIENSKSNKPIPTTFDFFVVDNEKDAVMKIDIGYTKMSDLAILP